MAREAGAAGAGKKDVEIIVAASAKGTDQIQKLIKVLHELQQTSVLTKDGAQKLTNQFRRTFATLAPTERTLKRNTKGWLTVGEALKVTTEKKRFVPPVLGAVTEALVKESQATRPNIENFATLAQVVVEATKGHDRMHKAAVIMRDELLKQGVQARDTKAQIADYTRQTSSGTWQTWKMSKALTISQSAAHGAMLGFGALNGSILQTMFSIIFLRFSLVDLTLVTGLTVAAVGGFVKALRAMATAGVEAAKQNEELRRTLLAFTNSAEKTALIMSDLREVMVEFGVPRDDLIKGFEALRKVGLATSSMLKATAMYARATGTSYSSAASEIVSAVKGNISALSILTATQRESRKEMWESMTVLQRSAYIVRMVNARYRDLSDLSAATTNELTATIRSGFGLIFDVFGRAFMLVIRPMLESLAFVAVKFGQAMDFLERNAVAAVAVTVGALALLGVVVFKVVVILKKLWLAVIKAHMEFKIFAEVAVKGAIKLVQAVGPAIGMTANQVERLSHSINSLTLDAQKATTTLKSFTATLKTIASAITAILFIMPMITDLITGISTLTDETAKQKEKTAAWIQTILSAIPVLTAVAMVILRILGVIATGFGIKVVAAVALGAFAFKLLAEAIGFVSDKIGHSPGLAEDLERLGLRLSAATVYASDFAGQLGRVASALTDVGRRAKGVGAPFPARPQIPPPPGVQPQEREEGPATWIADIGEWFSNIGQKIRDFFTGLFGKIGQWFNENILVPIIEFFTITLPETARKIGAWLNENIVQPIVNFFTITLPEFLFRIGEWLSQFIVRPIINFFTVTLPGALASIGIWLFTYLVQPVVNFFTKTVPASLSAVGQWLFNNIAKPVIDFFITTIPNAVRGIGSWLWNSIAQPVINFFTVTLPQLPSMIGNWLYQNIFRPIADFFSRLWPFGRGEGGTPPRMQYGGIVTRPTTVIAGEAGPEAILPLSRMHGLGGVVINVSGNYILDDSTASLLADRVAGAVMKAMRGYRPLPVTY